MTAPGGSHRLAEALATLPALRELPDHRAFERLAAMVLFRWLEEPTVHDIVLRGVTGAPHQMDVVVGDDRQRALIECKYLSRKIDLPIVRNFAAAVDDLGCDLAAIVTTVGYSDNADTFARGKGIEPLLLRDTLDADLEGRVRRIELEIIAVSVHLTHCKIHQVPDGEASDEQLVVELADRNVVIEHAAGKRVPFADRYHELHASLGLNSDAGVHRFADKYKAPTWLVIDDDRRAITRIEWEFTVSRGTTTSRVEHEPLVSLIDGDGQVLEVVSAEQLARFQADDT